MRSRRGDCFHVRFSEGNGRYFETTPKSTRSLSELIWGLWPLFMSDPTVPLLEVRPAVGQFDKHGAVLEIVSLGNNLATVVLIESLC